MLRYNPVLARAAPHCTTTGCSVPVQRFAFDNDAADEDLPADHWFWDDTVSGGIFVEHGVHFFDAAQHADRADPATHVQAMGDARAGRPDRHRRRAPWRTPAARWPATRTASATPTGPNGS